MGAAVGSTSWFGCSIAWRPVSCSCSSRSFCCMRTSFSTPLSTLHRPEDVLRSHVNEEYDGICCGVLMHRHGKDGCARTMKHHYGGVTSSHVNSSKTPRRIFSAI